MQATRSALQAGFRVTTNTTLYESANPERLREFFDTLMDLGVEGMMLSPGYSYAKAPDQENFLKREKTVAVVSAILERRPRRWRFNHSPLFLEFLQGNWQLECTPWGNPTYNVFGWQKPCYLLDEGYVETFQELLDTTNWEDYGRASGNPKCRDCMVHCGYEPTAVSETFGSLRGLMGAARSVVFGGLRRSAPTSAGSPVMTSTSVGQAVAVPQAAAIQRADHAHGCKSGGHCEPIQVYSLTSNAAAKPASVAGRDHERLVLPILSTQ